MDVTPLIPEGRQIIQSYGAAGFKVNGVSYDGAIVVSPAKTFAWDIPESFSALNREHFLDLMDLARDTDVFLLGTGKTGLFFDPDLRGSLKNHGVNIETMDTGAACRTYNVLMAEGRRVVAALMPL